MINTGHTGLENPHYGWWLRRQGTRLVTVIHDLIPITHPRFCRPGEPARHVTRMRCAARVSAGIIVNSQHTLDEFNAFCAKSGLTPPKAVMAPLGVGLPPAIPGARRIEGPYFVVLGTIEPRKNHWMLLQLWRRMAQTRGCAVPKLIVIGQRGWECEKVVELIVGCRALADVVIEKNRCVDEELADWLRHSRALLFPSFTEGYGLPVTEALSLGVPVIASELPVFREIAGDIPDYAEPSDERRWAELIADYAQPESPLRASQLSRMKGFRVPAWVQHFAQVDALIGEACPSDSVGAKGAAA